MDFIETVRTQAGLPDDDSAERGATAVLEALGGRIAGGNVAALAAGLPAPLAAALRKGSDGEAHAGGTLELVERTQSVLDEREDDAALEVDTMLVVVATLRGLATSADRDALDKVSSQLPADLTQLLIAEEEDETPVREAAGG